jgi:Spy/CpxP family protein refolding chaperone
MHPGFAYWWHARRHSHGGCGDHAEHGPGAHFGGPGDHDHGHGHGPPWARHGGGGGGGDDELGGGSFGVRRPLRFLAHKLDLNDDQVAELARILDDLKIERAQGAVDQRRTTSSFADAVATAAFDESKVKEAAEARVKSAERLRDAVVKALGRIHALLDGEQRGKLAYLLRTGALSI